MSDWGKPNFIVESKDFYDAVDKLQARTQVRDMRKILRTTSRKVYIPPLKSAAPVRTGKLKRSMGNITGKSRYAAIMFVGPRIPRGYRNMTDDEKRAFPYGGWVANILEYWKDPRKKRTRFRQIMASKSDVVQARIAAELKSLIWRDFYG